MKKIPIFDGHNDTLIKLNVPNLGDKQSFFLENTGGQLDLPRAKKGGMVGGLFGIFTPPLNTTEKKRGDPYSSSTDKTKAILNHEYASTYTNTAINFDYQLEKQSGGQVKIVQNYEQLEQAMTNDIFAMILHFEGATAIKRDLSDLKTYYDRGLRSLGLVWSRPNAFAHGVPFHYPHSPNTGPGLTQAGKKLVAACNNLGIVIDLAHINEKGFYDVAELSKYPLVVSHTGAHALCPSTRNLTDAQIDIVGASGGTIGVVFAPFIIDYKTNDDGTPDNNMPIIQLIKHIDYIARRIGIDHVSFGSDFDGASMPQELPDVSHLQKLINLLRENGYNDEAIEKIAHKNWLRVIKATWINHS